MHRRPRGQRDRRSPARRRARATARPARPHVRRTRRAGDRPARAERVRQDNPHALRRRRRTDHLGHRGGAGLARRFIAAAPPRGLRDPGGVGVHRPDGSGERAVLRGVVRRLAASADAALADVALADLATRKVATLSGGERARVSLACALLAWPDVLVLDEPTVGLDPVLRRDLWDRFHALAAGGTTLFVSSHVMDEASRCDRLLLLREGSLVADASPAALEAATGATDVEGAFLRLVRQQAP